MAISRLVSSVDRKGSALQIHNAFNLRMVTKNAPEKIYQFNKIGLHYNLVADAVYNFRNFVSDPFDPDYMPYIIAALVSFDMRRMMGPDANRMCDRKAGGFATLLEKKVNAIRPYIAHLANLRLDGTLRAINKFSPVTTIEKIFAQLFIIFYQAPYHK